MQDLRYAFRTLRNYIDRRTEAPAIEDATLVTAQAVSVNDGGNPEQLMAFSVTPSFFATLGVRPFIGRPFTDAEAKPGADKFVVLTYALWRSHYGADPGIVGRDIRVNADAYRVVGVLPADFEIPGREIALLVPFAFTPEQMSDQARGNEFSQMLARLRPGATIAQVNDQMQIITRHVMERVPARADFMRVSGFGGFAVPIREELVGDLRTPLYVMQACVLFVLFIACVNVANLLLMRASGRSRELAIRTTLGAGQWRIVRQMLTEGLVLAMAGGAGGMIAGSLGLQALLTLGGDRLPVGLHAHLDAAVLGFALVLTLVTGLVFGVFPAVIVNRGNASAFLKDDSARGTASARTGTIRTVLVVGEIAAAAALLIGAGLLIKSFDKLQSVNPGFSSDNVLTAQIALPRSRYPDSAVLASFWSRAIDRARTIPGVTVAGATTNVPFNGNVSSGSYSIVGRVAPPGEPAPHGRQEVVGGDYFQAMRIPLVAGRLFTDGDTATSPRVVVVDEYLVKKYFADRNALGRQIQRGGPDSPKYTIVGVVGTINSIDLGQPVTKERLYYPVAQVPVRAMALVVKTGLDSQTIVPQVRAAVRAVDPEQPIADVRTMDAWIGRSLSTRRAPTALLAVFGAVALVLAAIGIYGVLAFGVTQRVREFGIRQALGADSGSIRSLVIAQGLKAAGAGIALGVAAAFVLARSLESLLFGVAAHDVSVFGGVPMLLFFVALAACYVPARRATAVDPMVALRDL